MKLKVFFISILASCLMLVSCSELTNVASQLKGVANLANCQFSLKNVSNIAVCGIDLKRVSGGKVSVTDGVNLAAALVSKTVPLSMNVYIDVKNPTNQKANVTRLDWALDIDGAQIAQGTSHTSYVIPAQSSMAIPLGVSTDIYSLFANGGIESLKNFVTSFSSAGISSKVNLRIRPYINIAGYEYAYPSYFNLTNKK